MSKLDQGQMIEYLDTARKRMQVLGQQIQQLKQTASDIKSNWDGYVSLESDPAELQASGASFAARSRTMVDLRKADLAHTLDIIAAGMVDAQGNTLTRQDLLDELAAVPAE